MENSKVCTKCNKEKLYSEFGHRGEAQGYLKSHCLKCTREYGRNHRRKMLALGYDYERKYNLTLEQYNKLVEKQDGKCAICKKIPDHTLRNGLKSSKLFVDHDEATKCVRGLLCQFCNAGIGQLHHSIDLLEAAIIYLRGGKDGY